MKRALSIFFVFFSLNLHASDYNCVYKISYRPSPSSDSSGIQKIIESNFAQLKACNGKTPCVLKYVQKEIVFNISDPENNNYPSRLYKVEVRSQKECSVKASNDAIMIRKLPLLKIVEASYEGTPMFKKVCKFEQGCEEINPRSESTNKTPTSTSQTSQ